MTSWLVSCPAPLPSFDSFSWAFSCLCGVFSLRYLMPSSFMRAISVMFYPPLFRCACFLLGRAYCCLSLAVLLYHSSPSPSLLYYAVHYPLPLLRLPVPPSSRFLPSLVWDGVPLLHSYCSFSSSLALSLRGFLLSFDFPYLLCIPFARCAVYPSLVRLPLALLRPSGLVLHWDSLSLWAFPWVFLLILRRSSSFKVVQYILLLLFLLPCVSYSLRIFVVLRVSGDSCLGFSAIIRSRLPLPRRFTSTPLSCSPLGSLPHLSSPSTTFWCSFALTDFYAALRWLFFFSFHRFFWDFPLPLSFLFVRFLALGAYDLLLFLLSPTLFPLLRLLFVCGFGSPSSPLPPPSFSFASYRSDYRHLVFLYAVVLDCRGLPPCCYSLADSFEFSLPMRHDLIPSILLFVWACELGSGAFLFPPAFLPCRCLSGSSLSPWHTTYAVNGPLASGHAVPFLLVVGSFR